MTDSEQRQHRNHPSLKRHWGSWLLASAAWMVHLSASYSLVEWYCRNQAAVEETTIKILLNSITLICLLIAGTGAWIGWLLLRQMPAQTAGKRAGWSRFMAKTGIMISAFFILIILAQGIPNLVLEPCFF